MRDLLELPIKDSDFVDGVVPYGHPGADSPEVRYLQERRAALGGPAPARRMHPLAPLPAPAEKAFASFDKGSGSQNVATTMAFVRLVKDLVRDKETGKRWVPIVPDEARTFGMESLFPSLGIYSPKGQTYEPVDRDQLMYYKEAKNGQILNEGITEAGSMADFIAASTAYATHGEAMIPFYIFYSMFGWQRTADQMWQLGDQLGRGFLVGATAGRTTLTGEGLQHADGHSPVIAATNPAALSYDPAFAYEVAAIVKDGLRRMYGEAAPGEDPNVFYYLTVYNEPMPQPAKPAVVGVDEGIVKGLYRFNTAESAGVTSRRPTPRASSCSAPARRSTGRSRRRSCSPRSGAWPPTCGPRPPGPSCAATPWRRTRPCCAARSGSRSSGRRSRVPRARCSRSPTTCARSPTRSRSGSSRTAPRWAPTASASRTPVRRPAATSASTPSRSSSRPWPSSRGGARSRRPR